VMLVMVVIVIIIIMITAAPLLLRSLVAIRCFGYSGIMTLLLLVIFIIIIIMSTGASFIVSVFCGNFKLWVVWT
jgi:hypothetical protein